MTVRRLDRDEWRIFCIHATHLFQGKRANIEVVSEDFGAHTETTGLPLLGIVFDPTSDVIEIAVDGIDHLIFNPREMYVDDEPLGTVSLGIIDADGAKQIVILSDPLMLPSANAWP